MRNICSWLVSGIILFAISGVAYAGDYYCAERSPRTARPVFVCKDVKKARKDMRKVVKASHVRAVHERLDDLAEALGLSRGTPLAMCAEGRGFAAAVLPTVAASPVSRWTGSGITPLANGMYEIRGDAAEQMASGCSGNTGGGVGGGSNSSDDRVNGPHGGMAGFISGANRLTMTERDQLVVRARSFMSGLSTCTTRNRNQLIQNPAAAAAVAGAAAGGGSDIAGAGAGVINTIFGGFFAEAGKQEAEDMFDQHFMGADYAAEGHMVSPGVVRFKSKTDPENSYLDVYQRNNAEGYPEGTKEAVNKKAAGGGKFVARQIAGGNYQSYEIHETEDGTYERQINSGDGKSQLVEIYTSELPDGDADTAHITKETTNYAGEWDDKNKKITSKTTEYSDGTKDVQEYDKDGNPSGRPKHYEAGQAPGRPTPDNPNANTCEGRAQWVAGMLNFCESQNWQPPTCHAILMLANNCADPFVTDPAPDGSELICRSRNANLDSRQMSCERRRMIELSRPGDVRSNCRIAPIDASMLNRDRGNIDPVRDNLRPTVERCTAGQPNCPSEPQR